MRELVRYLTVTIAFAALVAVLDRLRPAVNETTSALILVLAVISVAVIAGRAPALYASILAGLSFNYFYVGTAYSMSITRVADGVALTAFVTTAVLVGQLSSRLQKRVIQTEVQQKQLEQVHARASAQAAQADELRKSEQLKTALLDAVTHDLRTPLTSIKAAITTIRQKQIAPEVHKELCEVIEQEADRLNHFIQGMMDMAQLEAGSITLKSRTVSAEAIVEDALLRAEPLLARHAVETSIEPDLPPMDVDARLISQVIFSLVENAAKYSAEGTKIEISARRNGGSSVCFAVTDEGPGIAPEMRAEVFKKFFRAGKQPGFGVGLAIAHSIVQAHNGRIWIEDGAGGRGATVEFQIPVGNYGK
jgi:K+-sensing histidine kinase KdpD